MSFLDKNERDLVILRHEIGIAWPDNKREVRGINFVVYGDINGHSAMAKTVGYPTAIATKMVLDGILYFSSWYYLQSFHIIFCR